MRTLSPCFLFRPDAFARACLRKLRTRPERCVVETAWGDPIEVRPRTFIGAQVYMRGVHELGVCETLWRLGSPGEHVVDVGANIGVMTSLLSKRVGPSGRVFGFEPHPVLHADLEQNVGRWGRHNIKLFQCAASNAAGVARLCEDPAFSVNNGLARLADNCGPGRSFDVPTIRLDAVLPRHQYGVVKIDVEGCEADVLVGAQGLLKAGCVRDVVFESLSGFAGPASRLLLGWGYQLFKIQTSFAGPKLVPLERHSGAASAQGSQESDANTQHYFQRRAAERPLGHGRDYLATLDPARARALIAPIGWNVLRKPSHHPSRTR